MLYHVYICIPTYRVYLYIVEKSLDSYIFNTFLCVESCTSSEKNTKGTLRLQGHERPKHASVGNPVGFRGFWGFKTKVERDKHLSVQITIFHQPNFPWNQGISLPQLHFGEVAMIWRHLSQHLSFNNESITLSILNKLYNFRMFQGGSHFFQLNQQDVFYTSPTCQHATIEVSHFKTSPKILSGVDLGYVFCRRWTWRWLKRREFLFGLPK